jgi:hypothetical protein
MLFVFACFSTAVQGRSRQEEDAPVLGPADGVQRSAQLMQKERERNALRFVDAHFLQTSMSGFVGYGGCAIQRIGR